MTHGELVSAKGQFIATLRLRSPFGVSMVSSVRLLRESCCIVSSVHYAETAVICTRLDTRVPMVGSVTTVVLRCI